MGALGAAQAETRAPAMALKESQDALAKSRSNFEASRHEEVVRHAQFEQRFEAWWASATASDVARCAAASASCKASDAAQAVASAKLRLAQDKDTGNARELSDLQEARKREQARADAAEASANGAIAAELDQGARRRCCSERAVMELMRRRSVQLMRRRSAQAKRAAEEKLEREAEEKAKRAGEHEMQVSLGRKSGGGVRAAASEDAGTSPAPSQVLFSTVPMVFLAYCCYCSTECMC